MKELARVLERLIAAKGMERDYRPDAVAKRWTSMLDENEGSGRWSADDQSGDC